MSSVGVPLPPVNPLNRSIRVARRWLMGLVLLALFGIAGMILSHWIGGFPVQAAGILCLIWGALGAVIVPFVLASYRKQQREVDQMINQGQVLGRWRCSIEEWQRHIQSERKRSKKALFVVAGIIGITMLILMAVCAYTMHTSVDPVPTSVWLIVAGIFFVICGFIGFIGWLAATLPVRRLKHPDNHEVYIGGGGMILGGKFHSWETFGARLYSVKYEPGDPGALQFGWMQPGAGYEGLPAQLEVRAPVPKFADSVARNIVQVFAGRLNPETIKSSRQSASPSPLP